MIKVAIVTGGEGGIGRAICARLLQSDYFVVAADISVKGPPQRDSQLARINLDVTDNESVLRTIAYGAEQGSLCALVNCAGVIRESQVFEQPGEPIKLMLDINVLGAARMTAAIAPHMKSGGAIVNISSVSSRLPELSNAVHYGASKSALETYTRAAACSLISSGIRVNAVAPGFIDVDMSVAMQEIAHADGSPLRRVAAGRMGTAEEIAECVEFLLSERASYVVGATLIADGGLAIQ